MESELEINWKLHSRDVLELVYCCVICYNVTIQNHEFMGVLNSYFIL
jgi:hypothetical protein